jgi:hypothetical protein
VRPVEANVPNGRIGCEPIDGAVRDEIVSERPDCLTLDTAEAPFEHIGRLREIRRNYSKFHDGNPDRFRGPASLKKQAE